VVLVGAVAFEAHRLGVKPILWYCAYKACRVYALQCLFALLSAPTTFHQGAQELHVTYLNTRHLPEPPLHAVHTPVRVCKEKQDLKEQTLIEQYLKEPYLKMKGQVIGQALSASAISKQYQQVLSARSSLAV